MRLLADWISDRVNDSRIVRESVLLLCAIVLAWQLTRRRWPEWIWPILCGLVVGLAIPGGWIK